jgi:two-component system response regulator FlrC
VTETGSTVVVRALAEPPAEQYVVRSELMVRLLGLARRVAPSSAAVLITGETGVGKEFIARFLHDNSLRAAKPYVAVNCAALPEHLVESELFGYAKGAFSGADTAKPGLFELTEGGTLFLDEIGELETKIQVKLLRVLDGAPYYRLGGSTKIAPNVRIIAATNQLLEEAVRSGKFRRDVYHRLCQFQLRVPALRERREDIMPLVEHFLRQEQLPLNLSPDTIGILQRYPWPGNVRELRNVVLQAGAKAENNEILPGDLPASLLSAMTEREAPEAVPADMQSIERKAILDALARTGGHQGRAAQILGISRRTLCRKLKEYRAQQADEPGEALGVLSPEQQIAYRTNIELPVRLQTTEGSEMELQSVNLSTSGICVSGIRPGVRVSGAVRMCLRMPDGAAVERSGRVVWTDLGGRAGIQFLDAPRVQQDVLAVWLRGQQAAEGWASSTPRG